MLMNLFKRPESLGSLDECFYLESNPRCQTEQEKSDLTDAYGSVSREILMRSMDHFYIPHKVT